MSKINVPFKFCRIERAANLLGMEPEDFIHLASVNKIELSINVGFVDARMTFYPLIEHIESIEKKIYESVDVNFMNFSKLTEFSWFFFPQISRGYIDDIEGLQLCVDGLLSGTYCADGIASGIWTVEPFLIRKLELCNEVKLKEFSLSTSGYTGLYNSTSFMSIYDPDERVITRNDLWINYVDFNRVVKSNGDINKLDDIKGNKYFNREGNKDEYIVSIHPTTERHAINREQILNAALRFIEEQPNVFKDNCRKKDGAINYSAFARELLERHHFFPNGEPPIKTQESIAGILSNAYKSPNQK